MAKTLNGFETTDGTTYKKKRDAQDRIYYVREGDGIIGYGTDGAGAKAFAGAKAHFKYALNMGDPEDARDPTAEVTLPPEIRNASTTQELERLTNIPFTERGFDPIAEETTEGNIAAEKNRFWGFYEENFEVYDDKTEAAKDYLKFRRELDHASDAEARAIVKSRYNIGGS